MTEAISDRNSYLDSETKKKLETLDTDYSKVNWDVPDGRIHWTDLNLVLNESNSQYVSCEADWALSNSDDSSEVILKYNLYAMEPFVAGYIFGLALDQDGNVVYIFDMYEEEATSCLTNSIAADEDLSEREVKDVALFFNALTK